MAPLTAVLSQATRIHVMAVKTYYGPSSKDNTNFRILSPITNLLRDSWCAGEGESQTARTARSLESNPYPQALRVCACRDLYIQGRAADQDAIDPRLNLIYP